MAQAADGNLGDLSTATATFKNSTTSATLCTSPVTAGGAAGCTFTAAPGTYQVKVDVGGRFIGTTAADTALTVTATPAPPVPDTLLTSGPAAWLLDATASFVFSSTLAGSTFACATDGASAPCTSPYALSGLSPTSHVVTIAASKAGQTDPTPVRSVFTVPVDDASLKDKAGAWKRKKRGRRLPGDLQQDEEEGRGPHVQGQGRPRAGADRRQGPEVRQGQGLPRQEAAQDGEAEGPEGRPSAGRARHLRGADLGQAEDRDRLGQDRADRGAGRRDDALTPRLRTAPPSTRSAASPRAGRAPAMAARVGATRLPTRQAPTMTVSASPRAPARWRSGTGSCRVPVSRLSTTTPVAPAEASGTSATHGTGADRDHEQGRRQHGEGARGRGVDEPGQHRRGERAEAEERGGQPERAVVAPPPVESERQQGDAGDGDDQVEQARVAERQDPCRAAATVRSMPGDRLGRARRRGSGMSTEATRHQATTLRRPRPPGVHGRSAGVSISPPSAGPTTQADTSTVTSSSLARAALRAGHGGERGGDRRVGRGAGRDREGRRDDREPDVVDGDRDGGTCQEGQPRGVVARTSRSRRNRSPRDPTAHESRTYGAIRAAPARPTTHAPCGPRRTGPTRAPAAGARAARWRATRRRTT